jgi:hypothetical protein
VAENGASYAHEGLMSGCSRVVLMLTLVKSPTALSPEIMSLSTRCYERQSISNHIWSLSNSMNVRFSFCTVYAALSPSHTLTFSQSNADGTIFFSLTRASRSLT